MNYKLLFLVIFILSINSVSAAEITTFVNPDCSYETLEKFISESSSSLYIAVYEFTNPCIADLLKEKDDIQIILLVEDSPVGGLKLDEKKILCELKENNVEIFFYKGEGFHHAKYIIRDNSSVLAVSENFGYTGFSENPSFGNRGWGAIVEDKITEDFISIFFEDLKNSEEFKCELKNYEMTCNPKEGNYTPKFESEKFSNQEVYSIFAPNAIDEIIELINTANESIYIQQMYIYKYWGSRKTGSVEETPNLFLESAIDKSREGIEVKILLDSYWYNIDKSNPVSNYYTVKYVNEIAEEEKLNLEAKLVNLNELGFEKIHNKGMIIDNKTVLVSSINWNEHSPKNNREAGVVITGDSAEYYVNVFFHDWSINENVQEDIQNIKITEDEGNEEYLLAGLFGIIIAGVFVVYFKIRKT